VGNRGTFSKRPVLAVSVGIVAHAIGPSDRLELEVAVVLSERLLRHSPSIGRIHGDRTAEYGTVPGNEKAPPKRGSRFGIRRPPGMKNLGGARSEPSDAGRASLAGGSVKLTGAPRRIQL
jgi:hypothetical protein